MLFQSRSRGGNTMGTVQSVDNRELQTLHMQFFCFCYVVNEFSIFYSLMKYSLHPGYNDSKEKNVCGYGLQPFSEVQGPHVARCVFL